MKKTLITICISVLTTLVTIVGFYNYAPFKFIETGKDPRLGSTITTIQGTDTLSSSRSVINTNFSNLNEGKIENSSSSIAAITTLSNLVTVGTLTSGSLGSGFTTVAVARGGTGTTSPPLYRVILGNASGGYTFASNTGTSGQFLTSNGAGAYPTWQSSAIDQGANYVWTGFHTFNASTTLNATSSFNGFLYSTKPGSTTPGWFAVSTGAANTYVIDNLQPPPANYLLAMQVNFVVSATNTGASTLEIARLGAKPIKGRNGIDLVGGELRPNALAKVIFNGNNFELQNSQNAIYELSTAQVGTGVCPSASGGSVGWTDVDMSATIGAQNTIVLLRAVISAGTASDIAFRKNGNTDEFASTTMKAVSGSSVYVTVPTDASGIIECRNGTAGGAYNLFLEGYWKK